MYVLDIPSMNYLKKIASMPTETDKAHEVFKIRHGTELEPSIA
jgi:hypothetical protein